MEQVPAQALVAIGAISAAIIAGAFSYLNLVISKDQKISEFRQVWIDALREDISQFVSAISFLSNANSMLDEEARKTLSWHEHAKAMEPSFEKASRAYTMIMLRVNPDDKNKNLKELNRDFLATLSTVRQHVREDKYDEARELADQLEIKARPILKLEWDRVKDGEPVFRTTRYIAASILIVALAVGGLFLMSSLFSTQGVTANKPEQPTAKGAG
ncbi:hypothetical protein [Dyella thiooxydans]|uniref:hypothetical protein n=1 Tax=Dyella thiooxydans TaxID=445710 RepID=UPI000AE74281|nr:hypothetical protein [Dyella thiooxydans]